MASGDACEVGRARMKSPTGGLGATSSSAEMASECPIDWSIAAGGMPPPAEAAHLREVEIHPAAERLHQRSKLRFGRGQAADVEALRCREQLFEGGQRLRRQQVREDLHEKFARSTRGRRCRKDGRR
jgi:hypothetical protein